MDKEKNIETVNQLYANVGAKNLEGVLNSLTDDIRWEPPFVAEIPHTKLRNGKNEVTNFVIEMAAEVSFNQFMPQEIYADKDTVIVKGFFEGTANHTGKTFESDWVHIWKFRGNKICGYQAFWNTNRMLNALK
ncbi:MAG: nuclear transport factor 2 family protein [Chitinophagales bacterium]